MEKRGFPFAFQREKTKAQEWLDLIGPNCQHRALIKNYICKHMLNPIHMHLIELGPTQLLHQILSGQEKAFKVKQWPAVHKNNWTEQIVQPSQGRIFLPREDSTTFSLSLYSKCFFWVKLKQSQACLILHSYIFSYFWCVCKYFWRVNQQLISPGLKINAPHPQSFTSQGQIRIGLNLPACCHDAAV